MPRSRLQAHVGGVGHAVASTTRTAPACRALATSRRTATGRGRGGGVTDHEVDPLDQPPGRHRPLGGGDTHDRQAREGDAVLGGGQRPEIGRPHERAPRTGRRGLGHEREGESPGPRPVALDHAAPPQPAVGEERGEGSCDGQQPGPAGRRRADPGGECPQRDVGGGEHMFAW